MIREVVRTGQFGDEAAKAFLAKALIERRDAICRKDLTAVNPVVDPELDPDGRLTFKNRAVDAGFARPPSSYRVHWSVFDNATGVAKELGETSAPQPSMSGPPGLPDAVGVCVKAQISASGGPDPSWELR